MNNSARRLVTLSLALLLVSGFSVRAEDQPMARAPLPPPLPISVPDAQSAPSAATPETRRAPKPVGESVQNGSWTHRPIHLTHHSSSKQKHTAAADRTSSSSVKRAVRDKHPVPPRPPDQIASGQQMAGAMPFPGRPLPPPYGYYPGYPPGYALYPPAYQYSWPRGPASPW